METENPNYYAIIPAEVRYDKRLRPNEKLMYGEITCLANKMGYCFSSNAYFSELYDVTPQAISKWVSDLEKYGYIQCEYLHNGTEVKERRIYISTKVEKVKETKSTKVEKGINKSLKGYKQKFKDNITSINNTRVNNTSISAMPKKDFKIIIDSYYRNFKKLYENGLVATDKPAINMKQAGALLNNLLENYSKDQILSVLDKALLDDWIISKAYSLSIILSANVFNGLINGKDKNSYSGNNSKGFDKSKLKDRDALAGITEV